MLFSSLFESFYCVLSVSTNVLIDMVGKISKPEVALVHQIPFTSDQPGLAAAIEKVHLCN